MAYQELLVSNVILLQHITLALLLQESTHPCSMILLLLVPLKRRCCPPRTLQSIVVSHTAFVAAGGNKRHLMHFMNCLTEPFFDIPTTQVLVHLSAMIACT